MSGMQQGSVSSPMGMNSTSSLNVSINNGPSSAGSVSSASGYSPGMVGTGQRHPTSSLDSPTSAPEILGKKRLQELVKEIDPNEQLEEDVETMLLQIADDFIEQAVGSACALAKHRKANTLEVEDVQFVLEKSWNMWLPGFGYSEIRQRKRSSATEAHKSRVALIKKTLKKY